MTDQKVPEWVNHHRASQGLPPLDVARPTTTDLRFMACEMRWLYCMLADMPVSHPSRLQTGELMYESMLSRFAAGYARPADRVEGEIRKLCIDTHPDHPNAVCSLHAAHIIPHKSAGGLEWPEVPTCGAPRPADMDQQCELPRGHDGHHRVEAPSWEDPCSAESPEGFGTCSRPPDHAGEHQRWDPHGVAIARWEEPDCWTASWCPQCGPDVRVDEEGLCNSCGSTAIGDGAERAAKLRKLLRELAPLMDEAMLELRR